MADEWFWRPCDLAFQKCLNSPCAYGANLSLVPRNVPSCSVCRDARPVGYIGTLADTPPPLLPSPAPDAAAPTGSETDRPVERRRKRRRRTVDLFHPLADSVDDSVPQDRVDALPAESAPVNVPLVRRNRPPPQDSFSRFIMSPDRVGDPLGFAQARRNYINRTNREVIPVCGGVAL